MMLLCDKVPFFIVSSVNDSLQSRIALSISIFTDFNTDPTNIEFRTISSSRTRAQKRMPQDGSSVLRRTGRPIHWTTSMVGSSASLKEVLQISSQPTAMGIARCVLCEIKNA